MTQALDATLAQALALFNAGRQSEAEALCARLLRRGEHPGAHQFMAVLRAGQQRWEEALLHIERCLTLRPGHAPSIQIASRIWFALSLGRHEERDLAGEQAALLRTLALQPDHVEALVNLGIVSQELGDLPAAMRSYARAWRLRDDTFGRIANALCSERTGALWLDQEALREALRAS
jgi:tetratricopeptide (TPR) repeat protein